MRVQERVFRVVKVAGAVDRIEEAGRQLVGGPVDDGSQRRRSFAGAAPATGPSAVLGRLVNVNAGGRVGIGREIRRRTIALAKDRILEVSIWSGTPPGEGWIPRLYRACAAARTGP